MGIGACAFPKLRSFLDSSLLLFFLVHDSSLFSFSSIVSLEFVPIFFCSGGCAYGRLFCFFFLSSDASHCVL